jgi:hypothetical protein
MDKKLIRPFFCTCCKGFVGRANIHRDRWPPR